MIERTESHQFNEVIEDHLPFFDELLSSTNVPLSQRPLRAALLFVEHCVIEVEGDDRKRPLGKRWFKAIYEIVAKWYDDRYAAAMGQMENSAPGLISIFNTLFQITIPLTLIEPAKPHTVWVTFPKEVLSGEHVLEWLVNPPNLERMSTQELSRLTNNIVDVATATRSIRINVMTATDPCKDFQLLIGSIPLHIDRSIEDVLKRDDSSTGLAVWEMHLAVEKSLKLLIRQQGTMHRNTHDLLELSELAIELLSLNIDIDALRKLPSHQEAIQARYGEGRVRSLQEMLQNYETVLNMTAYLTKALKREYVFDNARFLIRSPVHPK